MQSAEEIESEAVILAPVRTVYFFYITTEVSIFSANSTNTC